MKRENLSKEELINWAKEVRKACSEEGDASAVQKIDAAIETYESEKFVFSLMGLAKRGKSTLINALLGRRDDTYAPIDELPATSVCTTFTYAPAECVEVVFRNGNVTRIQPNEIRDYATEEGNPKNSKEVQLIRVSAPFVEKFENVTLVDLPGADSIHEHHDQIIYQFLPQSDAVLLLTTARMPISSGEIELLNAVQENDVGKVFVAMNQIDCVDECEIEEGENANRKKLANTKISVNEIYKISAKQAFEGDWENSGVPALMNDILAFIDANRGKLVKNRFVLCVESVLEKMRKAVEMEATISDLSPENLSKLETEFAIKKDEFEKQNKIRSKDFKLRWDGIIDEFAASLPKVRSDVEIALTEKMDSFGIANVGRLKKEMPAFFAKTIEEKLAIESQKMERRLRSLAKKYDEECPSLYVSSDGTVSSNPSISRTSEILLSGTGATLAVGGGLFATIASGLTTTTLVTSTATGASGLLGWLGLSNIGFSIPGICSLGAAGTATTTTTPFVAPTFLATIANPIGWTIAGIGALTLGCAWGVKRHKDLKKTREYILEKVKASFVDIESRQIPALKDLGERIVSELENAWSQQLVSMESAMKKAALHAQDADVRKRRDRLSKLVKVV